MKIFIGGIATETNTFAMAPTGEKAFDVRRGDDPEPGPWHETVSRLAARDGVQAIIGMTAEAQPDGPTVRGAYEALRDRLVDEVRAAMPLGAVILPLHGAMVADGYPDCEGDIIEHVRRVVGPDIPIGVELDLHCHLTQRMCDAADLIIAYKEYPHTDVLDRFEELWGLVIAAARGQVRPVTEVVDCRMVSFWHTTREPMRSFVERMKQEEARPGVLSVSFGHGFPWGDVPEAGAKVWVVADNDRGLARTVAEDLANILWADREKSRGHETTLAAALDRLAAAGPGAPLVLADIADNPGGGASGDSTFILRGLVERGIGNAALGAFWDLGAIQICVDAGEGARLQLRIGGKCGPLSGDPVDLPVTVRRIREDHVQTIPGYAESACGRSVWVATDDGLDIVLISRRQQVFATDLFTGLGVELGDKAAIVVKSSQHFHAQFAPLARDVLYVDTPGLLRSDFANIPYRVRDLNYWPRVSDPWAQT